MEDEVGKGLVLLLTEELDEGLRGQLLTELVSRQAVLGKAEVKGLLDCG